MLTLHFHVGNPKFGHLPWPGKLARDSDLGGAMNPLRKLPQTTPG